MALIYCVEDDDGIRELISCALKSGGYEVKAFPKAKPFYEEIRNKEPSLVLLDIMLPDEDGYSILSKLKKDSHTQDVPVIMLTAKSSELDKVSGLEMGADDYITKPFGVMELLSRISLWKWSGAMSLQGKQELLICTSRPSDKSLKPQAVRILSKQSAA